MKPVMRSIRILPRGKQRIIAALVGLVLLGSLILLHLLTPPEPIYKGKKISYWIDQLGTLERQPAISDVGGYGSMPRIDSNAIPYVLKALKRKDSSVNREYTRLWFKLPIRIAFRIPAPISRARIRERLTQALGGMGDVAKPTIPALIHELQSDEDSWMRMWAAEALGNLGRNLEPVKAALLEATNDKSPEVHDMAAYALKQWEANWPERPAMTNQISDQR